MQIYRTFIHLSASILFPPPASLRHIWQVNAADIYVARREALGSTDSVGVTVTKLANSSVAS